MNLPSTAKASPYRVQVLDRTFGILNAFAENGSTELGGPELSARLGLHRSTVHRLLTVLERNRYLEKNPVSGKYRLGWKLVELGMHAVSRLDLSEIARPHLERLVEETGETAHMGILRQGEMISVANVESRKTLRTPLTVGRRTPAHCSSQGKVLLAFLPPGTLQEFVRSHGLKAYTGNTITRVSRLQRELETVRQRGYAVDEEESEEGLKCIGAPVHDYSGRIVAAISIAGPASRLGDKRMGHLIHSVTQAASGLSTALGYQPGQEGATHLAADV